MRAKEIVSNNLAKYRRKKGLTQKQLAELLGVKNTSISNWENGVSSLDIELLAKICEILEISVSDMYCINNDEPIAIGLDAETGDIIPRLDDEEIASTISDIRTSAINDLMELPEEALGEVAYFIGLIKHKYMKG